MNEILIYVLIIAAFADDVGAVIGCVEESLRIYIQTTATPNH